MQGHPISLAKKVRIGPDVSSPGGRLCVPPSTSKISLSFLKRKTDSFEFTTRKRPCLSPIADPFSFSARPSIVAQGCEDVAQDAGTSCGSNDSVAVAEPTQISVQGLAVPAAVEPGRLRDPSTPLSEPAPFVEGAVDNEAGCAAGGDQKSIIEKTPHPLRSSSINLLLSCRRSWQNFLRFCRVLGEM